MSRVTGGLALPRFLLHPPPPKKNPGYASDPFILPNGTKLNCLLYADDLILLSRSKFGLQKSLDDPTLLEKKMAYGDKFEENANNDI